MTSRLHIPLLLCVTLAVVLAGCGRRGSLDRPAGATKQQPHGEDGTASEQEKKMPHGPHRSFLLDPLIR